MWPLYKCYHKILKYEKQNRQKQKVSLSGMLHEPVLADKLRSAFLKLKRWVLEVSGHFIKRSKPLHVKVVPLTRSVTCVERSNVLWEWTELGRSNHGANDRYVPVVWLFWKTWSDCYKELNWPFPNFLQLCSVFKKKIHDWSLKNHNNKTN